MNVLSKDKQVMVISALAEGSSIRAIERMTGINRNTIMNLGARVGHACQKLLDEKMRNLPCTRIEIDEVWGFIGKKRANVKQGDDKNEVGDAWVFLSIDPETKLMPSFLVGRRDAYHSNMFMDDLAGRLANRIQLSTDSLKSYADAVDRAFGADVDYAQIVKTYSAPVKEEQRRYSPARLSTVYKIAINGEPEVGLVSTSMIERANLTLRTHCKRMARLTLAFSKKKENFVSAIALHICYYNFIKFHGTLRMTPAMAAGIENSPWTVNDLLDATI